MTRGNFVLITNTANWMSIQFNGDMYPSCNGKFVYHMLESVEIYDDLAAAILKFDHILPLTRCMIFICQYR